MHNLEHLDDSDDPVSTLKQLRRYHRPLTPTSQVLTNDTDRTSFVSRSPSYSQISSESFQEAAPLEVIQQLVVPKKKKRGINIDWQEIMQFDKEQEALDFFKENYSGYMEFRRTDDKVTFRCSEFRSGCPHQLQLHFVNHSFEVSLRQNLVDHDHDNLADGSMYNIKKKRQGLFEESVALKHGVAQVRTHLQLHGVPVPDQPHLSAQYQYYRRKNSNNGQPVSTLSDLISWIENHSEIPLDTEQHKPFVAYYSVLRQENEQQVKFLVLLTTRQLLEMLLHSVKILKTAPL